MVRDVVQVRLAVTTPPGRSSPSESVVVDARYK